MSSYSFSSSILLIQFPTSITDSAVKQVAFFKPLNLNFQQGRSIQRQLNHRARCQNFVKPLRLRCSTPSSGGDRLHDDAIVLHVQGMMCEGCASSVKKILETQPQVLSATVNLASETALVSPLLSDEEKAPPNWQKQLGETLAHHLTTCGFTTTLRGQEDSN